MGERLTGRSNRRQFLAAAGGAALALTVRPASATPAAMTLAIRKVAGESEIKPGKVKIDMPPLVENGNAVTMTVSVDSPMTAADHVKSIHVFTERNPQPNVIDVSLGPRAGRASITTRIRLADTQKITAIAQLSDGSFWSDSIEVIITLGACLEDNLI
ncbi:MAG: SoxY-related AACIE arm protein [Alphaproteobacteria bacterium]|nr:SoxY-related AACIE arm protein [Alphaproteobacteria bacterium]